MFLYCVYSAISKRPKQLPNCRCNSFYGVFCEVRTCTVTVTPHESCIRKAKSWSVTVYSKHNIQSMQFDCSNQTSAG